MIGAQRHLQALRRRHGLRRADGLQPPGEQGQARLALQMPVVRALSQPGVQGLQALRLPGAEAQRFALAPLLAGGVGQQIDQGADDGLDRLGRRLDAPPARCAQRDDLGVVDGRDAARIQPACFAAQQVGQHGRQVQGFAVDLHAQAQQPGAFALGQPQLLHGARAGAQRAVHLLGVGLAGVGGEHQLPALHRHAFMREAGPDHHAPAPRPQAGHGVGPEIAECSLLRQRPQRAQAGARIGAAPLQRAKVDGQQAQLPHQVDRVRLGGQVALQAQHAFTRAGHFLQCGGAAVEDGGGRGRLPEHGAWRAGGAVVTGVPVGPVDLRHGDAVAARADGALALQTEQPVAPAQRHQSEGGLEMPGDGAVRWRRRRRPGCCGFGAPHQRHHAGGLGIGRGGQSLQLGRAGAAPQGGDPCRDHRLPVGWRRVGIGGRGRRAGCSHWPAIVPCGAGAGRRSGPSGIAQHPGEELVAEVDAQSRERAVAVGLDRGQAQTQVAGDAVVRHALQQARADIDLARGQAPLQAQQSLLQRAEVRPRCRPGQGDVLACQRQQKRRNRFEGAEMPVVKGWLVRMAVEVEGQNGAVLRVIQRHRDTLGYAMGVIHPSPVVSRDLAGRDMAEPGPGCSLRRTPGAVAAAGP